MKHRVLLQLGIPLLILCALFLLLAYPADRTLRPQPLLEVSVILRETDVNLWTNARQGMEQAEEYAAEISGRIGEDLSGSVRSAVEEELALIGLSPTEYQLEIGLGSEQILVTVLLPKDSTADPAEISDCLEQDPMIQTNVIKEEAE